MAMGRSWAPGLVSHSLLHQSPLEGPWDRTPQSGPVPLSCIPEDQGVMHPLLPSWSLCVCALGISRQRVPGAGWVGLGVSGCLDMQDTGPGSSWLGYPDVIPCLQNISLPMSVPGQHNLPSASTAGWTFGWLLGCGMDSGHSHGTCSSPPCMVMASW